MSALNHKRKRAEETSSGSSLSLLQSGEEMAFPRGGASALTPLELKQVANEAASDVLFRNDNGTPKTGKQGSVKRKKTNKTEKAASSKTQDDDDEIELEPFVEHLSFKNILVGTLLLGQITHINKHELCVTFTDNLSGYVSLTHISEPMTGHLESLDSSMSDESEDGESSDADYDSDEDKAKNHAYKSSKDLPDLHSYFKEGQWLRCVVQHNSALDRKQKGKRIELSIEPGLVNRFTEEDMKKGCSIQCAVKSLEDHGAILDVGVEGVTGFISKKDAESLGELIPGAVFLGNVSKETGRTVNVNLNFSNTRKHAISQISSIDAIVPGQCVDFLCQKEITHGVYGKVFGLVTAFLNTSHQHDAFSGKSHAIGTCLKVRILATVKTSKGNTAVIVSQLDHIMGLEKQVNGLEAFPRGFKIDACEFKGRDSQFFYLAIDDDHMGQVHISRIGSEEPSGSVEARVLGFNEVDGFYQLSTDPKTLKMKYLHACDIPVGEVLTGCEITAVSEKGIDLNVTDGNFKAVVAPLHISDVRLVYPERKFKIGSKVKGIVLNTDNRGRITMSLKKSLVNLDREEVHLASDFKEISEIATVDGKLAGTVESFKTNGCLVSFLGGLRGFLPNGEISESFVKRPQDHLRLGQTVMLKVLEHKKESNRIIVTCKVSSEAAAQEKEAIDKMVPGKSVVSVIAVEKTKDSVVVELKDVGPRGVIYVGHLSDSRIEQNRAQLKKLKIGSELQGVVIDKDARTRVFNLSCKKSLIKDALKGILPSSYEDIKAKDPRTVMHGYVKSISDKGVFVAFNGNFVGLVLPSYAVDSRDVDIQRKFYVNQSVDVYLLRTDDEHERFLLSMKKPKDDSEKLSFQNREQAVNPIDASIKSLDDFTVGKITRAKIKAVKRSQLNVILSDNMHGRLDVSEVYDSFDEIKDRKNPLATFKKDDVIDVRIIGYHDIKNHTFLPVSHKSSKSTLVELTARKSRMEGADSLTVGQIKIGDTLVAFVNNFSKERLWLTISPTIKASMSLFDLGDEGVLQNASLGENYPVGTALLVRVTSIDSDRNTLAVTGRSHLIEGIEDVELNKKIPAKVLKVADNYVLVDLGNDVKAVSFITDALDDYSKSLSDVYGNKRGYIINALVTSINNEESKINVSLRSESAQDGNVQSSNDLQQGDVVRGFVKKVTEKGVFVYLSSTVQAFVPVSKLSDSYLKNWKKFFKSAQPVIGKIVSCDSDSKVLMTLRESEVNGDLKILKGYGDVSVGDIFEGSVKNVTDFGVFIKLDNTSNLTGLAHRSQIADSQPADLTSLFGDGDRVKAIVLKVNPEKKQLSLGLKASYFKVQDRDEEPEEHVDQLSEDPKAVAENAHEDEDVMDVDGPQEDEQSDAEDDEVSTKLEKKAPVSSDGLSLSAGFDWTASILDQAQGSSESSEEEDFLSNKRTRNRKQQKKVQVEDRTIDINTKTPESVADFERLLMGTPNSSVAWMNYIAFQLQLGEIDKAREIADRALKTINYREEAEKLNIWIAMLNLENTFGTDGTLEEVFRKSCQFMDSFTMHMKLIGIYQASDKIESALDLFRTTSKKFGSEKVSLWVAWASLLLSQNRQDDAHEVLANAMRTLHKREHIEVVRKFAQLEFSEGDPEQGRSLFEGLLADAPKRIDLWNVYIDQEVKFGDKKKVEDLFERVITKKLTRKQAKFFFQKWLQYEESSDDFKTADYVKSKATEYVEGTQKSSDAA
ncbi:LAMI_0A03642g1_1 [Lachancea mirantina]|uniref:rRNA biogenesis protein RRP5 n=1 Tax=Lachancea mirantina TaxID=1230905 RepID=A0A1G4INS9_9SACH|nr:LAMI_0A03642g1_1 [Lachancea mirantina]